MDNSEIAIALPKCDDVWVIKTSKIFDFCLLHISYFLNCHIFTHEFSEKHSTLGTTPEPLKVCYVLKWNFPVI